MHVIEKDPFLRRFFARIPSHMASSFSDGQLDAIKRAFGSRTMGAHAVDLRLSIPIGGRSFYVVLLAGRERRSRRRVTWERRLRPLWTVGNVVVMALLASLVGLSLIAVLYPGRRAAHIDVFPGIDMLPDKQIERVLQ